MIPLGFLGPSVREKAGGGVARCSGKGGLPRLAGVGVVVRDAFRCGVNQYIQQDEERASDPLAWREAGF